MILKKFIPTTKQIPSGLLNKTFLISGILALALFISCVEENQSISEVISNEATAENNESNSNDESSSNNDTNTNDETTNPNTEISPGLFNQTLFHDGVNRQYVLYVPSSFDGTTAVPLMLNYHGYGGTATGQMEWADMRDLADEQNFILVYPQGTLLEGDPHWNAALPGGDNKSDADDLGFTAALIDLLNETYGIDTERVYACGYSNGAFFAYALACYRSDLVAAVGSVSGTMLEGTIALCDPAHPTAMINLHGTDDGVVPYNGGFGYESIDDVMSYWAQANGIEGTPTMNSAASGGSTIEHYAYPTGNNGTSITHYKIIGGGHVWFNINYNGSGTNELIWDFVSQYDINGLR